LNVYFPELGKRYNEIVGEIGYEAAKKHGCVRQHLIDVGHSGRSVFWESVWIDRLLSKAEARNDGRGQDLPLAIPDGRYANEAETVKKLKNRRAFVVRVKRKGCKAKHETEKRSIGEIVPDVVLRNDGTKEELYEKLETTMQLRERAVRSCDEFENQREALAREKSGVLRALYSLSAPASLETVDKTRSWDVRCDRYDVRDLERMEKNNRPARDGERAKESDPDASSGRKKRVYVAGGLVDKDCVRTVQRHLTERGECEITHDWTTVEPPSAGTVEIPGIETQEERRLRWRSYAAADSKGVKEADWVVLVFESPTYEYRGTCTELGIALGLNKKIAAVHVGARSVEETRDVRGGTYYGGSSECLLNEGDTYNRNPFLWLPQIAHFYCESPYPSDSFERCMKELKDYIRAVTK
jgi:nucleoside 2-deoxyribosyltransferase